MISFSVFGNADCNGQWVVLGSEKNAHERILYGRGLENEGAFSFIILLTTFIRDNYILSLTEDHWLSPFKRSLSLDMLHVQ